MVKRLVQRIINQTGWSLVKTSRIHSNHVNVVDWVYALIKASSGQLVLVQIGANDGVLNDPLINIIPRFQGRCLLVEPLGEAYERLVSRVHQWPWVITEQCAITLQDGPIPIFFPKSMNNEESTWASLDEKYLRDHYKEYESVLVPGLTLSSCITKHNFQTIDMLVVDVEGKDWDVVSQALAMTIKPKFIMYESWHFSDDLKKMSRESLCNAEYDWLDIGKDTVALYRPYLSSLLA